MAKKLKIVLGIAVVVAGIVAALVPAFIRAKTKPAMNACINNLRCIDGAIQQWALENHKTTNDVPTWKDIGPYLPWKGQIQTCPHGGTYKLGRLDTQPICTYPGDVLPANQSGHGLL